MLSLCCFPNDCNISDINKKKKKKRQQFVNIYTSHYRNSNTNPCFFFRKSFIQFSKLFREFSVVISRKYMSLLVSWYFHIQLIWLKPKQKCSTVCKLIVVWWVLTLNSPYRFDSHLCEAITLIWLYILFSSFIVRTSNVLNVIRVVIFIWLFPLCSNELSKMVRMFALLFECHSIAINGILNNF